MQSYEIRQKFLDFFAKRNHAVVPSASLVPENDPSVLFTTAGMQPLIPYLLGQKHPQGNRLVNVQKCVRTQDIEEVGDNTHDTFFEMLGNWSLGDYFKKDAITYSYQFLTDKEEGLGLDPNRLYVTSFEGDENAPRDEESFGIWKSLGIPEHRIYYLGKEKNWWAPGANGPCGPDTEMFYDVVGNLNLQNKEEFLAADDKQQVVEIWNDVFMEYEQKDGKVVGKLSQKNVDTGAGLERLSMMLQGKNNIFETDLFAGAIKSLTGTFPNLSVRSTRIIADHVRTSAFLIADGKK
jgi:alanyl-tRNA synthetase